MTTHSFLILLLLTATYAHPTVQPLQPADVPVIVLSNGSYYGRHESTYEQDIFLGIPFAQPPVGDLRLNPPQSLNTTWIGVKNATEYGYACFGYGEDTYTGAHNYTSEDCLTLNIVRPTGSENQSLPIGVWIYGGGYYEGSSLDQRYNLSFIVNQSVQIDKPFIGISINYRLHAWGWLWSKEIVDAGVANLGLRDQRLALHWIQENARGFGGDPTRVTIWGESAGATSVGLHMLAYNGRDDHLFSGAISESGPLTGVGLLNPSESVAESLYANITEAAGCRNTNDVLACLRRLSTQKLNMILEQIIGETEYQINFGPLIDSDIVAGPSLTQFLNGSFVHVPYLTGQNSDDGTDFIDFGINNDTAFREFFAGFGFNNETLSDLETLYPHQPGNEIPLSHQTDFNSTIGLHFKRGATLIGDLIFKAPQRIVAQGWSQRTNSSTAPLYSYRFNAIPNGIPDYFGVTHWQEVPFVFHNIHGVGFPSQDPPYYGPDPFTNRPQSFFQLSRLMSRMWASFISDGNPNFQGSGAVNWPLYNISKPSTFVFDANVTSYVEMDTQRAKEIGYLMQRFVSNRGVFAEHDQS